MGAVRVGLGTMRRLAETLGPAPHAFLIITLAASLFTDTANAIAIRSVTGASRQAQVTVRNATANPARNFRLVLSEPVATGPVADLVVVLAADDEPPGRHPLDVDRDAVRATAEG